MRICDEKKFWEKLRGGGGRLINGVREFYVDGICIDINVKCVMCVLYNGSMLSWERSTYLLDSCLQGHSSLVSSRDPLPKVLIAIDEVYSRI